MEENKIEKRIQKLERFAGKTERQIVELSEDLIEKLRTLREPLKKIAEYDPNKIAFGFQAAYWSVTFLCLTISLRVIINFFR